MKDNIIYTCDSCGVDTWYYGYHLPPNPNGTKTLCKDCYFKRRTGSYYIDCAVPVSLITRNFPREEQ